MVARVFGKANGQNIIFKHKGGDKWEITIPANLEGECIAEIYAEDEAGNVAYMCTMIFVICGHELQVKVMDRGYSGNADTQPFAGTISIGAFLAGVQEGGFAVERTVCS